MTVVRHLLLDADGVVQHVGGSGWRAAIERHLGERTTEFVAAVDRLEAPALRGESDFPDGLDAVLAEFGVAVDAEEFYAGVWLHIDPVPATLALAATVRERGVGVHLGTNQHPRRARHMKQVLGYDGLFDEGFYSCDLGVSKPDPGFFDAVCARLGTGAGEVLFVDDSEANVAAARQAGLAAVRWHHDEGDAVLRGLLVSHGLEPDGR